MPSPTGTSFRCSASAGVRLIGDDHRNHDQSLMQHTVVLEVVQQAARHALGRRSQHNGRAWDANGRVGA